MKVATIIFLLAAIGTASAFAPTPLSTSTPATLRPSSPLYMAKYKTLEEIVDLFPDDKPVLINFFDVNTENAIKDDILRAKNFLKDRCTLVSIKQQEYSEMAKLWNAAEKSPSMILFKDGKPVKRFYETTDFLEIAAKIGEFCN